MSRIVNFNYFFEVLDKLKSDKKSTDIPVIIVTSKNLTEHEYALLKTNAVHIMRKDAFLQEQFRQEVKRIVLS